MVVFFIGEGLASCSIYLAGQLHNETIVESKEQTEGTLGAFYIYQSIRTILQAGQLMPLLKTNSLV